jgi:xylulokinase
MRDNFYPMEYSNEKLLQYDTFDLINREAKNIPAGADGLLVLPYLMGERTPLWNADARGVIFGLSLNHTRGHVVKAMMESVAYALFDSFKILQDSGKQIKSPIVLNEGGAKSVLWRSIITDVFNVPTVLVKRRTGAPFGDAILAGVATGVFSDFSVARQWTEYVDRMDPDMANHNKYMRYFDLYKSLYSSVKDNYKELVALRN